MKDKKTALLNAINSFVVALKSEKDQEAEAVEVNLATMKLDDKVTVLEADSFEAGQSVMILTEDEQRIPLPVNEEGYILEDGKVLVVREEGVIYSIGEAQAEPEQPSEEAPADTSAVAQTEQTSALPVAKKIVEAVTRESHFSKEELEEVSEAVNTMLSKHQEVDPRDAEIEELKAKVLELSKIEDEMPAEKAIAHNPEPKETHEINLSSFKQGDLTSFLNARK